MERWQVRGDGANAPDGAVENGMHEAVSSSFYCHSARTMLPGAELR